MFIRSDRITGHNKLQYDHFWAEMVRAGTDSASRASRQVAGNGTIKLTENALSAGIADSEQIIGNTEIIHMSV